MKKIFVLIFSLFLISQSAVFADEIIDSKGVVIPCKIETVGDDFVEYIKGGSLYSFMRISDTPVFNDYVDVRTKLSKKDSDERLTGKVLVKDFWGVKINTNDGLVDIPFYRVKFVGVYKP